MGTFYKNTHYVEDFEIGDTLSVQTNTYDSLNRYDIVEVLSISVGSYSHHDPDTGEAIYFMKIKITKSSGNWYIAKNFKLEKKNRMNNRNKILAIAVDKPCIVYKMDETVNDAGVKVNMRSGDPIFVENYSTAQALTQKRIQDHIRIDNIYDTYIIYEQKAIAKAKEPPVVFESD
jgi:hypothetical protein